MKHVVVVGTLVASLALPAALVTAQPAAGNTALGSITLRQRVLADGQPLAPGTYQVRLTAEAPKPAVGQSPDSARYVEFLRGGKVVGKALATVIPQAEIGEVAKGPRPAAGGSRVDLLKGNEYVRVWINRGGSNYLIHMPAAAA